MPALDGLRGVAILLVIPHNTSLIDGVALHGAGYPFKELVLFGWTGVQLFFVLSGFLISGALLDSQDAPNYYSSFYARRALRILPLYYGALIVTFLILAPLRMLPTETLATLHGEVWLWTFLSNWTDGMYGDVKGFSHFWSLAVEEQFYLLWPLVLHRMPARRVLQLCLTLSAVAFAIRVAMRLGGASPDYLYEFTVCRMDALALGGAAAAALRVPAWQPTISRALPYLPWAALLILVSGAPLTHDYSRNGLETQTFGQSLLAVTFTLAVLAAARPADTRPTWFARSMSWAPLRSVGKYSYAMYVCHFPLHKWLGIPLLGSAATSPTMLTASAYAIALVVATYLLAWLSFHLYEQHFLRLKQYFLPQHRPVRA